jgi:hypothetical protein
MDETQVLVGVAEVAIALAGFSGLVVVFRARESWSAVDRSGLTALLLLSLATAAFAFLPLTIWEIAGSEDRVWRASSALWSIGDIGFVVWLRSRAARLRRADPAMPGLLPRGQFNLVSLGVFPLFAALAVTNAVFWGAFTPYLAVLVWGLAGSGLQFARNIQPVLR